MSSGQPSKRVQRAKSELTHRRTTMDTMKNEFRTKFLNKLRSRRSRSMDRLRKMVEDYDINGECKVSLQGLHLILLAEKGADELLNTDDVSDLLKEVEAEMRQVSLEYEAETHAKQTEKEIADAAERLMDNCQVCQQSSFETICQNCSVQISSEFM